MLRYITELVAIEAFLGRIAFLILFIYVRVVSFLARFWHQIEGETSIDYFIGILRDQ